VVHFAPLQHPACGSVQKYSAYPVASTSTVTASVSPAVVFDEAAYGGTGDGVVNRDDAIWHSIRLWTDRNHDGVSQPSEIDTLGAVHIEELVLTATRVHNVDEHGNILMFEGEYVKKLVDASGASKPVLRRMDDIAFAHVSP
jgi:hypothetical protein